VTENWVQQILGSTLVTTIILSIGAGAWKIARDKRKNRHIDDRDTLTELRDMRAAAEQHILGFDLPLSEAVLQLRAKINQLEVGQNMPPTVFPPLPSPIPLFKHKGDGA
jgi:hypothetical protein